MGSMAISADAASIGGAATQSPVLRVIVENLFYPVTLDVLHQVKEYYAVWLIDEMFFYLFLFFNWLLIKT